MKTAYQKPTLVVVKIKAKYHMMVGSEKVTFGSDYSSNDQVLSRRGRNTYWEDDEE